MKKKCFAPCIIILAVLLIVLGVTSGYAVGNAWDRWIKTEVVVGDVMKKLILASRFAAAAELLKRPDFPLQ